MVLALPFLIGVAVALPLGGRLSTLVKLQLKWIWVVYLALAFQIAAFPGHRMPWRTPDSVAVGLWIASDVLLVSVVIRNGRLFGVPLVALGLFSNLIAVLANGGHMPALPSALKGAGLHYHVSQNSERMLHPALPWLVDRWAAPSWIPLANVFSVGDVIIAVGGFILALAVTGARVPGLTKLKKLRPAGI
ncbi:MAG: DUF5317 domain-containing protein [Actinobacteria bacterium]|nr:DUF5317 domain-containing protein [Actinomycetota bacterium]MBV8479844.1 DUF5317 domain-containing protein [Actinomycetota bacterium]